VVPLDGIAALARRLEGRAIVVVDEAYGEFADGDSALALRARHRNLAVLRTLSKAHALAAARIGCVIADPALVAVLRACQAPYPVPAPCAELALQALTPEAHAETQRRVEVVRGERARMAAALRQLPGVRRVYPSQGNFLLVRFKDAQRAFDALLAAGVVVRDQRAAPGLQDALRITVGTPEENDRVLATLSRKESPSSPRKRGPMDVLDQQLTSLGSRLRENDEIPDASRDREAAKAPRIEGLAESGVAFATSSLSASVKRS
jgi:histidinol-phosphate aminotransferase